MEASENLEQAEKEESDNPKCTSSKLAKETTELSSYMVNAIKAETSQSGLNTEPWLFTVIQLPEEFVQSQKTPARENSKQQP